MSTPLLVTKVFVPAALQQAVARTGLIARLDERGVNGLTLLSAPAGFGKTTLLSAWVARVGAPAAWVSLDADDSDPARFLTCVIAALQTVAPGLGQAWPDALASAQPPSVASVLASLLNEISALAGPVVLVLDDYHATDSAAVDAAVSFVLDHVPPQLRLVISTRQDPGLPLARLRARGQLTELRAADLRFTAAEAAEYLNAVMGLNLSDEDVGRLEQRTEGWIAGLQLAALSMRGHHDPAAFIGTFAGDHRYIADYLVGEVLARQPADIRRFLLQTAVLDRMTGALCDAVTGQRDSHGRLEALERGNFFVVPLDDNRHWYRYHHLFAEVLRTYLAEEQPEEIATLHRRASEWFHSAGAPADAIRHALLAHDFERAAELVELAAPAMHRARTEATALGWFRALPDDVFRRRPVLSAFYAATLLVSGKLDGVEQRLRQAERWLQPPGSPDGEACRSSGDMVVLDADAFEHLPASIAMWRSGLALWAGQTDEAERQARRALELLGDDDHQIRGSAAALLGLVAWSRGNLQEAFTLYAQGRDALRDAGSLPDAVACAITLADIRIAQGRLREAMTIYRQGLELASPEGSPVLRGAADMHVGMCELHLEQGERDAAVAQLARCMQLGEATGFPQNPYRWRAAAARLRLADGDASGAVELLDAAERVYSNDFSPKLRPVAAMRARVWVAQGQLGDARGWVQQQGLSVNDDLSYLREFEHITLARVLLAHARSESGTASVLAEARELLERLLHEAEAGQRMSSVLEILVLQALAHQASGDLSAALVPLNRALALADRECQVATFLDEGAPMTTLLDAACRQDAPHRYAQHLLSRTGTGDGPAREDQPLIDPLSARELDVLRLLSGDLDGPAMARELVVSLHTVRSHTKSIYTKLGVSSRRAAVRQAEHLHLVPARQRQGG
jgi:LuxR family maltose regulon positive regulatory protein